MRKETSSPDCLFHSEFVCFLASRHLICLCSSHSTFTLWCHLKLSLSSHSYMENRENNRPQPSDLPNWMASHLPFIPLYVNQGSLLPDDIKIICFVWWNVRSTGEGEQKKTDRGRGEAQQQQQQQQRKIQPGAEREMMWRERWGSQDIKIHTEIVKGRRRRRKDGVWKQRWTDRFGQWARAVPGQATAN